MCRSDALPKCICSECWEKTHTFHRFHRCVRIAQEEYLSQIVKNPQTSFVEVPTNYDALNEFIDEYTSKLDNDDEEEKKEGGQIDEMQTSPCELADILGDKFDCQIAEEVQSGKVIFCVFHFQQNINCKTFFRTRVTLRTR